MNIDTSNWIPNIFWGSLIFLGGLLVATVLFVLFVMLPLMATGQYHYDYRCNTGVTQEKMYLELGPLDMPFGGWDAIDGDSVASACEGEPR